MPETRMRYCEKCGLGLATQQTTETCPRCIQVAQLAKLKLSEEQQASESVTPVTLRDYFAARAMQSLLIIGATKIGERKATDGSTFEDPDQPWYFGGGYAGGGEWGELTLARDAYQLADAMLEVRKEST